MNQINCNQEGVTLIMTKRVRIVSFMNISSRCDYACRAVVELAESAQADKPMTAAAIAEKREIPEKYLVHILLQLKKAGVVRSIRGAQGGYLLARSPEAVSLLDIVTAVDGPVLDPLPGENHKSESLTSAWKGVAGSLETSLQGITIQSIVDRASKSDMYFI